MPGSRVSRARAVGGLFALILAGCHGDAVLTDTSPTDRSPLSGSAISVAIQDLGTLGGALSDAIDINASGQVVGNSWTAGRVESVFIWDAVNGMRDIGLALGAAESDLAQYAHAAAINSSGHIVGSLGSTGRTFSFSRAFFWSPETGAIKLPHLPGGRRTGASDINDAGIVVGAGQGWREPRAFQWSASAGTTVLPLLPGASGSSASAINESGWIVGNSNVRVGGKQRLRATLWRPGQPPVDLGALVEKGKSWATEVNEAGDIVGVSLVEGIGHATLWRFSTGEMIDIGALGGANSSAALDINDAGQVVGVFNLPLRAFRWDPVNGFQDLGSLPPTQWSAARSINNAGQITGWSHVAPGVPHAVLWQ